MKDICILGAGISGLALAANLNREFDILEKRPHSGGLCSTIVENGFTFDIGGPHIIFSKNSKVLDYMVSILGTNIVKQFRNSKILYKGHYVKYPFENGLGNLPKEDCFECLRDYINNNYTNEPTNLGEWAYSTFGKSISEKYLLPYNKKIWNCDPFQISIDWVSRIPKPPTEDVLKSAIGISTEGYLHQLYFYYPKIGGFQELTNLLYKKVNDKTFFNQEVIKIKKILDGWEVQTTNATHQYKTLVSTIPTHKLLNIWNEAPSQTHEVINNLKINGLINVLIGFKSPTHSPYTTIYIADPDIPFHRITIPYNFSNNNVPDKCSSIATEITANPSDDIWNKTNEDLINIVIDNLKKINLLNKEEIIYAKVIKISYAYPLYNLDYSKNTKQLHSLIEDCGLHLLGRFARFEYINSDVCVEQALDLAYKLNNHM